MATYFDVVVIGRRFNQYNNYVFIFVQLLNKAFFLPQIGSGDEIRTQYQQLAQVNTVRVVQID